MKPSRPTLAAAALTVALIASAGVAGYQLFACGGAASFGQDTNVISLLRAAPCALGERYHCQAMVRAVDGLRGLGKDRALTILQSYLDEVGPQGDPRQKQKVLLVCRLLFVNPQGWRPPRLGHAEPDVAPDAAQSFPLFPIALSKNVPFLLVRGYAAAGYSGDTPEKCVQLCQALNLISADLAEVNYRSAAEDLIQGNEFQRLYLASQERMNMAALILAQADPEGGVRSK
jgi:hypothetical protein